MNTLRFTPYAWAKLLYMRDRGTSEVGGYGISSVEDPLLVTDFRLVKQEAGGAHFEFDDEGLADFVEEMSIDHEMQPSEFQRILIHTHPGNSASPSGIDEDNFNEKMSDCNWSIMFILANGGQTTCALKYKNPPIRVQLGCQIDFMEEFYGVDNETHKEWEEEYNDLVNVKKYVPAVAATGVISGAASNLVRMNTGGATGTKLPEKIKNPDYDAMFDNDGAYGYGGYNFEPNSFLEGEAVDKDSGYKTFEEELEDEMTAEEIAAELGCTIEEVKAFGIEIDDKKAISDLKNGVR